MSVMHRVMLLVFLLVGAGSAFAKQKIVAAEELSCALSTTGGVKCWGKNDFGQLGVASAQIRTFTKPEADVVGLGSGVTSIAGGVWGHFACALTTAGGVKCWGANYFGQLGDGTTTQRLSPVNVSGLTSGVVAISAGGEHACAVTEAGGVKCWGYNSSGQLGDGTQINRSAPVDVIGLASGVVQVAAGQYLSCAVLENGGVKCWGSGILTPLDVIGLTSGVVQVSVGVYHRCAVTTAGAVKCWGANFDGQLGDGTHITRTEPTDVIGLSNGVAQVSAGSFHSCAVTTAGAVKCWGYNAQGRLGNGTVTTSSTPVDVVGLSSGAIEVAAGNDQTCAMSAWGGMSCWGRNLIGELGYGTLMPSAIPLGVVGFDDWDNDGVPDVSDAFPLNAAESLDTDLDGIGNNADLDDDNDGLPDVMDPLPLQAKFNLDANYKGSQLRDDVAPH